MNPFQFSLTGYQKMILQIFFVIFLLCMVILFFVTINRPIENWPPKISNCPDYWVDTSGNGAHCVNVQYLGTCSKIKNKTSFIQEDPDISKQNNNFENAETMNFSISPYTGSQGNCKKYTWAKGCGISWSGITYGTEKNPCNSF